jgi:6-phosphogluconolactonase (cycloisomerase 2 family)
MCVNPNPVLFATTTSNQILSFAIGSNGSLSALTSNPGPANSNSLANLGLFLMFADPATNQVASDQINGNGILTTVTGSPFSLGTAAGGPSSILGTPTGFLYASEPDGTIVGFSTSGDGTLTAPVPNSPFAAGVSPTQMAVATLSGSAPAPNALYASDAANPNGGILTYTVDSAGSLSPIGSSAFAAAPNTTAESVLVASPYLLVSVVNNATLLNTGSVAVLSIDQNTGNLSPISGSPFTSGHGAGSMVMDSSGHLFVLNRADHTLSAFSIGTDGSLTAIGSAVAAGTATGGITIGELFSSLVANPPYLYVADTTAGSILIFSINSATGALAPAGSLVIASPPLQLTTVSFPGLEPRN